MKTKTSAKSVVAFLLTFALCSLLIGITVSNRLNVERLNMEQLITEKSAKANEVISRLLYKTQTLSAVIMQNDGKIEDFERIATTIIDDPCILNLLMAPDGVVTNVYPLDGNEAVIGLNFFAEGAGNREAILAKETGQLVFGGPFNLVQGGQALVGRLPVYINNHDGNKEFWGLVSVTLKYPQALDGAGFSELKTQGFAYEIWRINPDNNERQIISDSGYAYNSHTRFIEKHMPIQSADWYFRILPVRVWYEYPEIWLMILLGASVSFLVAFVTKNNDELRFLKSRFEYMARTDLLTGIFNRGCFTDLASIQLERTVRLGSSSFVIFFDLDRFKKTNDTYGHPVGDKVLKEIVMRVNSVVRPYDLFARYGGEEFIMLASDIGKVEAQKLAERTRLSISETPIYIDGTQINITASFGVACVTSVNDLDAAIEAADKALYKAKAEGRNRVVFYERAETGDL